MSKNLYQLKDKQYLSDLNLKIEHQKNIFLIAPTGSGKTTFTMHDLGTQFNLVIVLVPTQAKVVELKSEFSSQKNTYKFYSGSESPDNELSKFKGTIVATYDKFQKILSNLSDVQKQNAILVIDEAHKLYSAGSFRDDALMPVLQALKLKTIATNLFLTATKTQELFDQLNLQIDINYKVEFATPIQREIHVWGLVNGDQYTAVTVIKNRIEALKKLNSKSSCLVPKKVILVRVNSREKCDQFKKYFEEKCQLKCLSVHSNSKNNADVAQIFDKQMIPPDVDIVFTTSIMDEAVNLTNPQEQVDSVFILGKQAHVEEIVQFIGRFRSANVPCYMLLHTELPNNTLAFQLEEIHQKHTDRLKGYIQRVEGIASALTSFIDDYKLDFDEKSDLSNIYTKIKRLNESFHDWFNCLLFSVHEGKPIANTASLVSALYRMDTAHSYSSFQYLKWRIQRHLPNAKISYTNQNDLITPEPVKAFFDQEKIDTTTAYEQSIEIGIKIFLDNAPLSDQNNKLSIKEISDHHIAKKNSSEDYITDLISMNNTVIHDKETTEVVNHIISLAQHIKNLEHIRTILKAGDYAQILKVAKGYADNEFIREFINRAYKTSKKPKFMKPTFKLDGSKAIKLLRNIIEAVQKNTGLPMLTIVKNNTIKGMRYNIN